jgi:hypothetical protein
MTDAPTLFVSYRHKDEDWKEPIEGQLRVAERQRALAIALELQESGRLAPVDAWMVDDLQSRIDALTAPAADSGG